MQHYNNIAFAAAVDGSSVVTGGVTFLAGATITVRNSAGSVATIYSDDGVTLKANPFTTSDDGEYDFYAANGTYSIETAKTGYTTDTRAGIVLFDPADRQGDRTILDFLPYGFDRSTADATTYAQQALDCGDSVVDFLSLPIKHDEVTVPAGVTAKNISATKYTDAAGNLFLVNTGCTLTGKLTGSSFTGGVQRGVYPAAAGVTDVALLLEVSGFTHSVQAAPVASASTANNPKRWTGYVYVNGAVGVVGNSEGYGVLLESAQACSLTVKAKDVRRHAVYLSAGASWNTVECDVDGCGNYAVQIAANDPQGACSSNTVLVSARNLTTDVAGQSGALAVVGKSHYNRCTINCTGNATTYEAVRVEGGSSGVQADHPIGNQIINGCITGQFTGADVIRMLNADSTIVRGNTIHAYGTSSVIASRRTGTNLSLHGGYIEGNQINAQGQAIKGIYNEINTVPSYIGPNDISNNSTGARVDDSTGGYRTGYSRRLKFSGTTASISATSVGDTTVTFAASQELAVSGRRANVYLTGGSVSFTDQHGVTRITHPSATTLAFRAFNGAVGGQTFDYEGVAEGD